MKITVVDARAQAAQLGAMSKALTDGADAAEAAGQMEFETVDALSTESQAALDAWQAAINAAPKT